MELLRTDYKDAVWPGLKKFITIKNDDDTISFRDVTEYTVKKEAFFGAKDVNAMNSATNAIMVALENGTDLYEVFTHFFADQKEKFTLQMEEESKDFKEQQELKWIEWIDYMKEQLSEDAAGHLQNQIGVLNNLQTNAKENLVKAVNEFYREFQADSLRFCNDGYILADNTGGALVQEYGSGQWCYITPKYYDEENYRDFNSEWAWYQLEFNNAENKSITESIKTSDSLVYEKETGLKGETVLNATAGTYAFDGMVVRLKRKPVGEFAIIVRSFIYHKGYRDSSKKLKVQSWDLPENYSVSIGSATAADSAIIYQNGIYTLKAYTISSNALAAIYQYVYFSDYNNAGAFVGKLSANTGALSNTYGTIAVSTADQGVKISTVKGYRIEVDVKPFD